jgi:hypothetical protein
MDSLPNKPLFEYDIYKKYRANKYFGGSASINKLPKLSKNKFYFVLLHPPNSNNGHWLLVINEANRSWIFDSFGLPPDKRLIRAVRDVNSAKHGQRRKIFTNDFQFQKSTKASCGYYGTYIVDKWLNGMKIEDVMNHELNKVSDFKED